MKNSISTAKRRLSLKSQGLAEDAIERSVADTFGSDGPKLKAIPRGVTRNLLRLFNKLGRASTVAVSWGKTGKFRTFSEDGYKSLQAHGKRVGSLNKKKPAPIGAHVDKK